MFQQYFGPQQAIRPDSVRTQFHLRLGHPLPSNPTAAYTAVTREANNLEARIAGSGIVGNNLAARLLSVQEDALYAQVLFLFLGLPGVILVIGLTLAIAGSAGQRRTSEQALLRVRGASVPQILRLVAGEAILVGIGGVLLGLLLALAFSRWLHIPLHQWGDRHVLTWLGLAMLVGLLLAFGAVLVPAWSLARQTTVAAARAVVRPRYTPLWQRMWLDIIILVIGAIEYWRTASSGYQVVLAPEGVAANAVNYEAFIAPLCLWIGGVLLTYRLITWALRGGAALLAGLLAPVAHGLSGLVGRSISRQQSLITRGIVLVAFALSFAVSTAIFNTTYSRQSRVDAELTNGSDVTVTGPTSNPPSTKLAALRAMPGVVAAQPMQHRFAYVGTDLQDIYGIDPRTIGAATNISDAFFGNHNAQATLDALARTPDGVLVALETVNDFQLQPGDQLNLRVQFASDRQYHVVPFHYIGIVREFPTAPTDSFLVANASYLSQVTGYPGYETVLMRVTGSPATVAQRARAVVADIPGAKVTDLGTVQRAISSSLTAIDLQGLTRLELAFAILFVAGSSGLILALGLAQRRRMFANHSAVGAKTAQLGAFLWSEGLLMLITGLIIGGLLGVAIAQVLVKMLTGIFDPPPEALAIPWGYLMLLLVAAIVSTIAAVIGIRWYASRQVLEAVRGL
ncbi:MAG TPA: ABC transporter permease [Armatimonadota bacterium]|nr:ABC transporter permease [Armatimonadota bacterium]